MSVLDRILSSHVVGANETEAYGSLIGVGFQVYDANGLLYSGAAGRQGFDTASPLYTTDTVQWIASLTKLITAVALLQLVDRGLIGLREDLRPRFSEFSSAQILSGFWPNGTAILVDNTEPLTLRHLLTHTSGYAYDLWNEPLIRWSASINRTENSFSWSREGFRTPLLFAPGESWTYSTGLDWAGYVLEEITGQSQEEYLQENIFKPLGMSSTSYNLSTIPNVAERFADWAIASPDDENHLIPESASFLVPQGEFSMYSGGSGIYSTAADYAKFLQAVLRGDLLSESTSKLVFQPQLTCSERTGLSNASAGDLWEILVPDIYPPGAPLDYGLSGVINLIDSPRRRKAGSLSWSGAANSRWWIDPETGIAAVMTTQVEPNNHPLPRELWRQLELAVYKELV